MILSAFAAFERLAFLGNARGKAGLPTSEMAAHAMRRDDVLPLGTGGPTVPKQPLSVSMRPPEPLVFRLYRQPQYSVFR